MQGPQCRRVPGVYKGLKRGQSGWSRVAEGRWWEIGHRSKKQQGRDKEGLGGPQVSCQCDEKPWEQRSQPEGPCRVQDSRLVAGLWWQQQTWQAVVTLGSIWKILKMEFLGLTMD